MAQLQYRTRGQVSPQGKPRVYFACHGEDHQGFFTEISDEILKISDCAVFYYEPGEVAPDEDYYLNLGRMQLFVMPVTTRLLYTENRAMDVEFRYAMEHHIPVLPLMQEQGLEQKYGEKFGALQFLDKNISDPTAIPYAEKLKKYLESVLVGDELAARVRAAFDAYIFLSYRKKDRKYAQELMRLLHRDEACRDIAIWYDEFLTPGEDFNASIRAALDKSDLFVLTVTPNLVNEPNYIIEHEYPMAKEAGKPILPAEMVVTDADALRANYAGIPDSVDPQNEQALTGAMLEAMRALALLENDGDPQHNFFIGLAYLAGIDVEVDHERAVRLITGAAETGLTEAMEKLVSMYENGEGVQRDYLMALFWKEKLLEQARHNYEQRPEGLNIENMEHYLLLVGDAWYLLYEFEKAKAIFEELHTFLCGLLEQSDVVKSRYRRHLYERNLALTCSRLADIARMQVDHAEERKWLARSLEIRQKHVDEHVVMSMWNLPRVYDDMGRLALNENNLTEAREWFEKSFQIRQRRYKTPDASALREFSISYDNFGKVSQKEKNYSEAKRWYSKSLKIAESLEQDGDPGAKGDLYVSYWLLGEVCEEEGNLTEARQWYLKRMETARELAKSGTLECRRKLMFSYNSLCGLAQKEGNEAEADEWLLLRVQTLWECADLGSSDLDEYSAPLLSKAGDICWKQGKLEDAVMWYLRVFELLNLPKGYYALPWMQKTYGKMMQIAPQLAGSPMAAAWEQKSEQIRQYLQSYMMPVESLDDLFDDLVSLEDLFG